MLKTLNGVVLLRIHTSSTQQYQKTESKLPAPLLGYAHIFLEPLRNYVSLPVLVIFSWFRGEKVLRTYLLYENAFFMWLNLLSPFEFPVISHLPVFILEPTN